MKDRTLAVPTARSTRRARGYLRWYPSSWRERYGDEFVAHLEVELEERPLSLRRTLNIALHGATTRFKLQASVRWMTGIALALVMVASLIIGVLALEDRNVGVPLNLNTDGAAGLLVSPKSVTNFGFQFTDRSTKPIRLTDVSIVGFRTYGIPRIVRVRVDPRRDGKSFLINPPSSTPGLVPAVGRLMILGNGDSLVVSMVAPTEGRLYAVEGLRLTYVNAGTRHVKTLSLRQDPELMCVVRTSVSKSTACNRDFQTAWALAQFYHPFTSHQTSAQREALIVTNAAFSYASGIERKVLDVNDVRQWSVSLFAHRGSWAIVRVTSTATNVTLGNTSRDSLFHFALRNRVTGIVTTVCVRDGALDSGGGTFAPALASCR